MPLLDNNNRFLWYMLLLLSLFIIVLFTKTQIINMQINLDEKALNEILYQEQRDELTKLEDIKNNIDEKDKNIDKYLINIKEDEVIDYIYTKIKSIDWDIIIKNISISEGKLNEMWFQESQITLNLRIPSETRMFEILDFLFAEDSKYKFFINAFTYPNIESKSSFNITLPLKVFYK